MGNIKPKRQLILCFLNDHLPGEAFGGHHYKQTLLS